MKLLYMDFADKATLRDLSKRYQIPGFNYCLIKEGVAQPVHAYGVQNAETGEPMLPSTIFEAASLTKTLFACLVLRLVDRGVLTLDEPIAKLAPNVQVSQDERIQTITARQVLSHGTGLPDWDKKPYLKFLFDPGTSYSYSGEGYYYLQKIVNEITGKDFTDHYWDEFLKPLGMTHSFPVWEPAVSEIESRKHDAKGALLPDRRHLDLEGDAPEPNAAWSLYSGAEDYTKYMLEILNAHGHLSDAMFREMTTPQNKATDGVFWGLGWGIPAKDPNVIWHWGDNGGYRSFTVMDLKTKDGACIFANGFQGNDMEIEFLDYLTDGDFWPDVADFVAHAE
ncbi:MAG: beta-lactamase family protein [Firmicutes bacterium]|nr:beta-lactamase family protein [Bacillota bacterium]